MHVKNQDHHSFAMRDMVPTEDPGLSVLGPIVRRVYDEKYRVLDWFVLQEKELSSHQKRYGDAVCQLRVLYNRLQRYPDPYAVIGPGCRDVPLGDTQAGVYCLRAATTGLEAWHLLGHEKRSSPMLASGDCPSDGCHPEGG